MASLCFEVCLSRAIRVVIVRLYHEGIAAETGPAGARKVVVSQGLEDPVVVLSRQ